MQTASDVQQVYTEESRTEEKRRRNAGKNKEITGKTPWNSNENSNRVVTEKKEHRSNQGPSMLEELTK